VQELPHISTHRCGQQGLAMIRPVRADETPALVEMAQGTGVFKPHEIQALREVLDDFHAGVNVNGHRAVVAEEDSQVLGFAYFAPAAMTDRTWSLWWIAVNKQVQARGLGAKLLRYVEDEAKAADCRILLIETSSLPHYDPTRRFYLKHGYEEHAFLRDYYSDGDDMVIYRKRLG